MTDYIQVYAETDLVRLASEGTELPDHLVSIGNPYLPWKKRMPGDYMPPIFKSTFKKILRLAFYDCETIELLGNMRPKRVPKLQDIQRVIQFYEKTKKDAVGYSVHCWGGISRSTAIALGLLYLHTGSEEESARRLAKIRPEAVPHRTILEFFDKELGCHLSETGTKIREIRMLSLKTELNDSLSESYEELESADDTELPF